MRNELDQTIASLNLTPMQKASYDFIRSLADGGKDSFVSTITLPHAFLVPPVAGTGYITLAAFNMHEFSRGSIVRPLVLHFAKQLVYLISRLAAH